MDQKSKVGFGQKNFHKGHGQMRVASPRTKPMILSRRTSNKMAHGSPRGLSPIVAVELKFDDNSTTYETSPDEEYYENPPATKKFKSNSRSKAKDSSRR